MRDQVELHEKSGGTEGTTLRDTGLPVIIVTHTGGKTGVIRKTPLTRVKDGAHSVLVGPMGYAQSGPARLRTTTREASESAAEEYAEAGADHVVRSLAQE